MPNLTNAAKIEREWMQILEKNGHLVTRSAGSGTSAFYDLHSINKKGQAFLWEIKSTKDKIKYFKKEERKKFKILLQHSKQFKFTPFLIIKYKGISPKFLALNPKVALQGNIKKDFYPNSNPITLFCPMCFLKQKFKKKELSKKEPPFCHYCNVPLWLQEKNSHEQRKRIP